MPVTVEMFGPQAQTLRVDVYPLASQVPVQQNVNATEWIPTRYRATFNSLAEGKYHLLLKSLDGYVVNSCQITIKGTGVQYGYDAQMRLEEKLEYVSPNAPVITIPAPTDPTQTTAWARCYGPDGALKANVMVEIKAQGPAKADHGVFAAGPISATSDAQGIVTITIPRVAGLRFMVRAEQGEWVPFMGCNASTIELPAMVG